MRSFIVLAAALFACESSNIADTQLFHKDRIQLHQVPVVATLTTGDVALYDEGVRVDGLTVVRPPSPVAVSVLVDINSEGGESLRTAVEVVRSSSKTWQVESPPSFLVNLNTAGPSQSSKDRPARLWRSASEASFRPFWSATYFAATRLTLRRHRQVLVIVSDANMLELSGVHGDRAAVRRTADDLVQWVRRAHVTVYAVGYRAELPRQLISAATESGGGVWAADNGPELASAIAAIGGVVSDSSLLYFTPPKLDGRIHKLELRDAQGVAVQRHRMTYEATVR